MSYTVYTIGYSTHQLGKVLQLLKQHAVTAVCDVRSQPYSRLNPQFNREPLKRELHSEGIAYVFLGKELGARTEDKSCYRNGRVQYDLLGKTDLFQEGLNRIENGLHSYRIALMCAEKDPLDCHRTILISRCLVDRGINILHILQDGSLEDHEQSLLRLIERLNLRQLNMFVSNDIISEAYRIQGNNIAYHKNDDATDAVLYAGTFFGATERHEA